MLYACDYAWWNKYDGVPSFGGLKISHNEHKPKPQWGLRLIEVVRGDDRLRTSKIGEVGWGGNSGFHAINLAVQFGVSRIVLVGFDMRLDGGLHWHGRHGAGLHNPTDGNVARWRRCIDDAAAELADLGVEVLNASPVSALTAYPKVTLEEAIECRS